MTKMGHECKKTKIGLKLIFVLVTVGPTLITGILEFRVNKTAVQTLA